ncbi:hypothetical protein [Acinetobacter entericus]|uniref:DUF1328 domain-containing protein n=1 Tax=Acinetobacter entericus TaxID=2989714 RepID=A0ABT3NP46_9GAMM|nr:hypothetical protein [Acinetobacter entericus]MCW8041327.1 hypothetical protein [Acinetobacter entericus]
MNINTTALKVIYLFVFAVFAVFAADAFVNSNSLHLLLSSIGFGATIRDLFVISFGKEGGEHE